MRPNRRGVLPLLLLALALASCGGLDESLPAGTGHVTVSLTDAPSYAFDNVWVTVRRVWFHKVGTAAFDNTASGWIRFTLDNGATVNLAALSGDNNLVTVFDNLALPAGTYRQMLLFLEPTESALTVSATARNLRFNNQVDAGTLHAALRVPNAAQGIRIADRVFQVDNGALIRLAIDFDVGRDVVPVNRDGVSEFILKPQLRSFDLDDAGVIVGFIDNTAARDTSAFFEIKAEQIDTRINARVVRRATAVDNNTGRFVLYPLDPGSYDLVSRGINYDTFIVRSVGPVAAGTTPVSNPRTFAAPITMDNALLPDYRVGAVVSPAGSRVLFYQTLTQGDAVPYEIRGRHVDPFTGRFDNFSLSNGPIHAGAYNNGSPVFTLAGGGGSFQVIAEAPFHTRSLSIDIDSSSAGSDIPVVNPSVPASLVISGTMTVPFLQTGVTLDNGVIFVVHGGQIVSRVPRTSADMATGNHPYMTAGLPGGFAEAFYGVTALGWSVPDDFLAVASPAAVADLRSAGDVVNLTMTSVPAP
ncbi:MAG: DUF4382 domain-containing protein [Deltaproteobacteria bacterium]